MPIIENSNKPETSSKLQTVCKELAAASYKCLEKHLGDSNSCSEQFQAYRACKKEEHERKIEARRNGLA